MRESAQFVQFCRKTFGDSIAFGDVHWGIFIECFGDARAELFAIVELVAQKGKRFIGRSQTQLFYQGDMFQGSAQLHYLSRIDFQSSDFRNQSFDVAHTAEGSFHLL